MRSDAVIALFVGCVGFFQAVDMRAGIWTRTSALRRSISASTGPFCSSIPALARSASAWRRSDGALFGVGAILGAFLFDLVAEVVVFGLRFAGEIDLLGAIEDRDEVAFLDFGAIGNQFGEGHGSALAEDLGDEDFGGVDGFDDSGDADFALGARRVWSGGVSHGRGSAGAGGEEDARIAASSSMRS